MGLKRAEEQGCAFDCVWEITAKFPGGDGGEGVGAFVQVDWCVEALSGCEEFG